MGAVWAALDASLRRRVAVKLMSPDHVASPAARSRFEREAMAIAQLQSPNVVQIYDYGIDGDTPYIVMELLDGEDLQTRLNRLGKLPITAAAPILNQVAKALAAAHATGIVHRDIKPANIFIARHDNDESVKVLDFGVAALVSGLLGAENAVTRAGGVVGTPHYMSPEQVRGSRGVDFKSDLWSLAVVAYRAVTGRLPFEAEAFGELLIEICTDPVPPPSRLGVSAELDSEADRFFDRALARDPAKRFGSAREMTAAFAALAARGGGRAERATKILVVDDEPDVALLMKQRFRQQIRKGLFEFVFAGDGEAALDQMRVHQDIEIALTDINMPGMDGLTFLRRAGELNPLVKVVVVSAYSDMSNIREAMNRGAFDFLVKPIDFKDLEVTIDKTVKHARDVRRTQRSSDENNVLRMFVNAGVLERILPATTGVLGAEAAAGIVSPNESLEATVAFIDVHGFTPLTSGNTADTANHALRALNANFEIIVPEITARRGVVDKFLGDAVMAVFRDEGHLERALDACLAARRALADLAARTGSSSPYAHGVAIGVDSGAMICGTIGSRVVSRLDYTVLGEVVNNAAHLQRSPLAVGRILVGEAVEKRIGEVFETETAGSLALGGEGLVLVFEVMRRVRDGAASSSAETVLMATNDSSEMETSSVTGRSDDDALASDLTG